MSLPTVLLTAVEQHTCFSGSYHSESVSDICTDPAHPLEQVIQVSCGECLLYRVGSLARHLPAGATQYSLATELSAHMRATRGFLWSFSGYHVRGGGFWLSAAAYTDSLFLVDATRNRNSQTEVELLVEAFRHQIGKASSTAMLDASKYSTDTVYVDLRQPISGPVQTKQSLLLQPQFSRAPRPDHVRAELVEFLPGAAIAAASPGSSPVVAAAVTRPLSVGETCPVCHAVFTERRLFSGTFVGCLC